MSSVWWIPCRNSGIHHHIPGHRPIVQSSSLLICDSHIDENFATTFHYSVENFSTIWNLLIQIFTWAVAQSLRCSDVLCGHHRQVSAWSLLSCPLSLNSSIMSLRASYWDSAIFLYQRLTKSVCIISCERDSRIIIECLSACQSSKTFLIFDLSIYDLSLNYLIS